MRVAVFNGAGKPVTIEDVADDPLGHGELRIEVGRCGMCGSDISMTSGSAFDYETGCRLGHETAGTVIELGRGVSDLKLGDRVAVMPRGYCGNCASCKAGRPLFCESGPVHFGGFAERLVVSQQSAFRFPAALCMAEGALVEPIACGRRALRMARFQPGDSLLVMGAGSMGLAAIYWARALGAGRIVVVTRTAARHDIALAMGADAAVATGSGDPGALARAMPQPPDLVIEATGKPGMLHAAVEHAKVGGAVISLGMCVAPDTVMPAFNAFKEVSLHFPVAYAVEDFVETIRAFDQGAIRPETMVSEVVELSDLPALMEEMRGEHSHQKVQVVPGLLARTESGIAD